MCGRSNFASQVQIESSLDIQHIGKQALRTTRSKLLLPNNRIPIVVHSPRYGLTLTSCIWGYDGIYNARSETIRLKGIWSKDYFNRRAVLPLESFYEGRWFSNSDGGLLFAAAIYRPVKIDDQITIQGSMITKSANETILPYHHRMPVLIPKHEVSRWLNIEMDIEEELEEPNLTVK